MQPSCTQSSQMPVRQALLCFDSQGWVWQRLCWGLSQLLTMPLLASRSVVAGGVDCAVLYPEAVLVGAYLP